eukprot:gene36006-43667_t
MTSFKDLLKKFKTSPSIAEAEPDVPVTRVQPAMVKLLEDVENFRNTSGATKDTAIDTEPISTVGVVKMQTLGLLFIIVEEMPNELLWRIWINQYVKEHDTGLQDMPIWIHAKHPDRINSPWVRERLVQSFHLRPEWGSIELSQVMVLLLLQALQDRPDVDRFVFVSESCIPIVPARQALDSIYANDKSWMRVFSSPDNGYAKQQQFDVLEEAGWPATSIWKGDQWILLTRRDATLIQGLLQPAHNNSSSVSIAPGSDSSPPSMASVRRHEVFKVMGKVRASDEVFFPSLLSLLWGKGLLDEAQAGEVNAEKDQSKVLCRRVTYVDWSDRGKSPKFFSSLTPTLHQLARSQGALFFRKIFVREEDGVQGWVEVVYGVDKGVAKDLIDATKATMAMEKKAQGEEDKERRDGWGRENT